MVLASNQLLAAPLTPSVALSGASPSCVSPPPRAACDAPTVMRSARRRARLDQLRLLGGVLSLSACFVDSLARRL